VTRRTRHLRLGVEAWGVAGDLFPTGMGQVTASLLVALDRYAPEVEVIAYGAPEEPRPAWLPAAVQWRAVGRRLPAKLTALHSRLRALPPVLAADNLDVFHAPAVHWRPLFPPVPAPPCPLVVTLHDVITRSYYDPRTLPWRQRVFGDWNLRRALGADAVLTVSAAARDEICALTRLPREALTVVHNAVDFEPNPDPEPLERLGLRRPYLLYAGSYEPRKNLAGMLDAYSVLAADGLPFDLVAVVEAASGHAPALLAQLRRLDLPAGRVHLVHSLLDADLRALYTGAELLCFPSLAEGFGFPPLQAAACGVPVVASDLPAIREVMGGAAVYVAAGDTHALARGITALLGSPSRRSRLRAAGPLRAAHFTPAAFARNHLHVYARLAGARGGVEAAVSPRERRLTGVR
jgi:glycosyltransferase involved in cell wall biosynthesis